MVGLFCLFAWANRPDKAPSEIEAKYKVTSEDYSEVAGLRFRLHDEGQRKAPAIILLHRIGSSLGTWDAWSVLLSRDFQYGKKSDLPFSLKLLPYVLPGSLVRLSLSPAYGDPKRLANVTVDRYRDFMLLPEFDPPMAARMEQVVLTRPEPILSRIQAQP